jgi:hypothetical protein
MTALSVWQDAFHDPTRRQAWSRRKGITDLTKRRSRGYRDDALRAPLGLGEFFYFFCHLLRGMPQKWNEQTNTLNQTNQMQ